MNEKSKLFTVFSTNPLIWFHYVLLTIGLFVAFYLFEGWLQGASGIEMFVFWFLVIGISDQLVHKILGVD